MISEFLNWYQNSGMRTAVIPIPLLELTILLLLMTGCLLLRFPRTGLMVAFLFVYRWGWIFCMSGALLDSRIRTMFLSGYVGFGILVVILTIVAMVLSKRYSHEE